MFPLESWCLHVLVTLASKNGLCMLKQRDRASFYSWLCTVLEWFSSILTLLWRRHWQYKEIFQIVLHVTPVINSATICIENYLNWLTLVLLKLNDFFSALVCNLNLSTCQHEITESLQTAKIVKNGLAPFSIYCIVQWGAFFSGKGENYSNLFLKYHSTFDIQQKQNWMKPIKNRISCQ